MSTKVRELKGRTAPQGSFRRNQRQEQEFHLVYLASQVDRIMQILLERPAKEVLDIIIDTQNQIAVARQVPENPAEDPGDRKEPPALESSE